jgi:hypothetical protein
MRKTILMLGIAVLPVLLGASRAFAQNNAPPVGSFRPFDEYGDLRSCDHGARLDNFAIQLQNEPRYHGYIVVYAPESASKRISKTITDYLVDSRGIPAKRLKTIHAGFNTELTTPRIQLWIAPRGATFEFVKHEVDLAAVKGKLAEYKDFDGLEMDFGPVEIDHSGTPVGSVTYEAVDEILKAQKHSVLHVVAFNGSDAVPGAWKRVAESTVADLKRLGWKSDRFQIGYGGQAKDTKTELWILPKGETPPVKDPASEPAPAKAVQIGDFDDYELGYGKNELVVFNRLLGVLRENPNMRACLIVRSETPTEEDEATEEASEPVVVPEEPGEPDGPDEPGRPAEPEPQPADLLKLVDKWKTELAAKHKLGLERIVLLYSKAPPGHLSSLEVWVVPPGQPLPNPDTEPEEEKPSDVVKDAQRRP